MRRSTQRLFWPLLRRLIFSLPPERAHDFALACLERGLVPACRTATAVRPRLLRTVAGLPFPNPLGVAAGFDKDGRVPMALLAQGFGFTETGTTTPRAQVGNPRPRVFRLTPDRALINRLGFNNAGHDALARRLERLPPRRDRPGIVGVNVGANRDAHDRIADYVAGVTRFAPLADYLTINISSPNTPGLRDLQGRDALRRLLGETLDGRERVLARGARCPMFVKLAPDLDAQGLEESLDVLLASPVEGLIVSNTTNARPATLRSPRRKETGGLSGEPLFEASTAMLREVRRAVGPERALIGVGGVHDVASARAKLAAGADLVQLYTGYVFEGPALVGEILAGLDAPGGAAAGAADGQGDGDGDRDGDGQG